jgi:hypothetical protein
LIIPGEGDAVGLMRSLGQLNDVKGDPRKKALIDTGNINQERQLDKTLGVRGGR